MTKAPDPNGTNGAMVQGMCAAGIPQAQIASACGLSEPTLRKHYRHQLDHGGILANAKVAANLFRMATGEGREAVAAAIFWMKTRGGWKETMVTKVEVVDKEAEHAAVAASLEAKLARLAESLAWQDAEAAARLPSN